MIPARITAGFTAVELLVTMFIAATFIIAGYQLYVEVIKTGSSADQTARISNIVYERLRKVAVTGTSSSCTPSTAGPSSVTVQGLKNVTLSTVTECITYGSTANGNITTAKITVTATYTDNEGTKKLSHATFSD